MAGFLGKKEQAISPKIKLAMKFEKLFLLIFLSINYIIIELRLIIISGKIP